MSVLNSANQYVTFVAPSGSIFTGAQALDNPSPVDVPADVTFPLAFVAFQLTGLLKGLPPWISSADGTEANLSPEIRPPKVRFVGRRTKLVAVVFDGQIYTSRCGGGAERERE